MIHDCGPIFNRKNCQIPSKSVIVFLVLNKTKHIQTFRVHGELLGICFRYLPSALAINIADEENYIGLWFSNFSAEQNYQAYLSKHRLPGPTSRVCDSVTLGWFLIRCISNKFSGHAVAASPGTGGSLIDNWLQHHLSFVNYNFHG